MLAPLRGYPSPKYPTLSSLLCVAKDYYFTHMTVKFGSNEPDFEEMLWITSKDICKCRAPARRLPNDRRELGRRLGGLEHFFWYKKRLTVPKAKIEELSDNHRFKPGCLFELSRLFYRPESLGMRASPFSRSKA